MLMVALCSGRLRSGFISTQDRARPSLFRFKLHRQHLIEFAQVAIHKAYHHDHMINRVMPKDNIALMAVLEVLPGVYRRGPDSPSFVLGEKSNDESVAVAPEESVAGSKILLCGAHVYWDPEFCDVKLIQSMMLIHECARQIEQLAEESGVGLQVYIWRRISQITSEFRTFLSSFAAISILYLTPESSNICVGV